jgi:hypothetical protein
MYLDFENEELGFESFYPTRENIRANIGRQICFVDHRSVCRHRGYYRVEYGIIDSIRYSQLLLDGGNNSVDIRDIVECGIKIVTD